MVNRDDKREDKDRDHDSLHREMQNLHREIQKDIFSAKEEILLKFDNYQKRVTKLETNQGWLKKGFYYLGGLMAGVVMYIVKLFITKTI